MNEERKEMAIGNALWHVLPAWVKLITCVIAFPAWLVMAVCTFTGNYLTFVFNTAVCAFAAVALIQFVFLFRAFWRKDL